MLKHTKMNVTRMNRLDKRASIAPELVDKIKSLPPQTWTVITEAWCGDAAQNLPWIKKMSDINPDINLNVVLRDENLELMDQFLTNGGRSIPKLIISNAEDEVIHDWGP